MLLTGTLIARRGGTSQKRFQRRNDGQRRMLGTSTAFVGIALFIASDMRRDEKQRTLLALGGGRYWPCEISQI
jgi:hypothetical protein